MRNNFSIISLIVFSLVTACASPINNSKTLQDNETTSKTVITGKAEFPQSNIKENNKESTLKTKDNISEIDDKIKVVLTYPSDHPVLANETIYTTIADTQGNFTIKPYSNFVPKINEIFLLEANKKINSTSMKYYHTKFKDYY